MKYYINIFIFVRIILINASSDESMNDYNDSYYNNSNIIDSYQSNFNQNNYYDDINQTVYYFYNNISNDSSSFNESIHDEMSASSSPTNEPTDFSTTYEYDDTTVIPTLSPSLIPTIEITNPTEYPSNLPTIYPLYVYTESPTINSDYAITLEPTNILIYNTTLKQSDSNKSNVSISFAFMYIALIWFASIITVLIIWFAWTKKENCNCFDIIFQHNKSVYSYDLNKLNTKTRQMISQYLEINYDDIDTKNNEPAKRLSENQLKRYNPMINSKIINLGQESEFTNDDYYIETTRGAKGEPDDYMTVTL